jgi:hypothetical protein
MKKKNDLSRLGDIANYFEVAIAIIILVIVVIRSVEIVAELFGANLVILQMSFERILSMTLTLVIGVEFTKMLFKHTPESVIDVLLFAIARQVVMYHERTMDMLFGIVGIAGLFAIKKFLVIRNRDKEEL